MQTIIFYTAQIINQLISVYMLAIVVYALMSWFPNAYGTAIGRFLARIVEPFERLFNFATIGMISLAPLVALAVLTFVQYGVTYVGNLLITMSSQ
ncbi:YggT family protein [Lentilactobacillus kisonensis]|uniref:YGGT family protein n=2 Tax=Lentilactobacillus kisonensis TaxID=481722 RepID=H1LCH8_9LACO|nr:YggT family protein [Lentilactobacillus kisonensis]EHO54061.1 YGGT family protein [Lentilactobacillus kisonensis F0435]KRL20441.1 YGGT family protein [Lentilactobacillus kisonensis DSM 19906 = JCM 15041]